MQSNHFYRIVSKNVPLKNAGEWKIIYYEGYSDLLFVPELHEEIIALIQFIIETQYTNSFRYNLNLGSIQVLAGIDVLLKKIYIASKQLSHELTLTRNTNGDKSESEMEFHAKAIATIPLENTPPMIDFISHRYRLAHFDDPNFLEVHHYSDQLAQDLVKKVDLYKQSFFEKISDFGLDLTANFMLVRIHLLKFLAILPSLDHDKKGLEVKRILIESIERILIDCKVAASRKLKGQQRALPLQYVYALQFILLLTKITPCVFLASFIRKSVGLMAKRFIAGENILLAQKSLKELIDTNRDATLDQLGELVISNKEADEYEKKVLEIIHGFSKHIMPGSKNKAGINQAHVSIKVSALSNDFRPYAFDQTYEKVAPRLKRILLAAKDHQVFVNIDAEHYHYRDIVLKIYAKILLETAELEAYKQTGIVVQAYLKDGYKHLQDVMALAQQRNICMPIRLVKGAYWDVETVEAEAHNFDSPEFLNKEETDLHYRQLAYEILKNHKYVQLVVASHNIQDHCFVEAVRTKLYPSAPVIEHQCLHMTYEALSIGLATMDWPTRNYVPIGNLLVGMAYLVRRIMENSSQVGILTLMRSHKKSLGHQTPGDILKTKFAKKEIIYDKSISQLTREFRNIYPLRNYLSEHFEKIDTQLKKIMEKLRKNNLFYQFGELPVYSSSDTSLLLAKIKYNSLEDVKEKIQTLFYGFQDDAWKIGHTSRYEKLFILADKLLINREELAALIMLEAGKTLEEAIADVDEAIDFILFYTKSHSDILNQQSDYQAKGVFAVIAPWNFPLAIPVGMTTAALACGNTVLLKPAEQTCLIAMKFLELTREAGIESTEFDIVLGEASIGKAMVENNLINGVVFTGSKKVGLEIFKRITPVLTDPIYGFKPVTKTVITEMGGKNAIIVTNNCELDETVSGIIYSAFAHSGQKCSAASRIIIDHEIKDVFIQRFIEAVKDLKVGKSFELDTMINPLITEEDKLRVKEIVKRATAEALSENGKVWLDLSHQDYPGFCVGPSVFELTFQRALHPESIAQQEIFGPVVHLIAYKNLDEAITLFNSTEYALTGGIYCQSQNDIDYLLPRLEVGNIYVNRPSTGARVATEPFGGFKMSGTGPKAGHKDYLYSFLRLPFEIENAAPSGTSIIDQKVLALSPSKMTKLSWRFKVERLSHILDEILVNYEVYFQTINENQKDILLSLKEYFIQDKHNLSVREYPNRKIPGQLSFNKKDMPLGQGFFVFSNERISLSSFVEVLINLYIGNGLNILCMNRTVFERWKTILAFIHKKGFSSYNIACDLVSDDSVKEFFSSSETDFIVFDYNTQLYQKIVSTFISHQTKLMRVFFSDVDFPLGDWDRYIDKFTITRSFAINTMRHGAPLEVDFN